MRKAAGLLVIAGVVLLAACEPVVSVHPIYTDSELVTDARLPGCWVAEPEEGPCLLTFTANDDKSYSLALTEDGGDQSAFRAHLAKLGDHLFLDIQPVEGEGNGPLHSFHMAALHTFYRVRFEGETLRLAMVDNEWIDEALTEGDVKLPHRRASEDNDGEIAEHSIVLTASTEQLQRFALKYVDDDEVYVELDAFYRGSADPTSQE